MRIDADREFENNASYCSQAQMFLRVPIKVDLAVLDITEALAHVRQKWFGNVIIEVSKRHFFRRYDTHPTAIELEEKPMRHA